MMAVNDRDDDRMTRYDNCFTGVTRRRRLSHNRKWYPNMSNVKIAFWSSLHFDYTGSDYTGASHYDKFDQSHSEPKVGVCHNAVADSDTFATTLRDMAQD